MTRSSPYFGGSSSPQLPFLCSIKLRKPYLRSQAVLQCSLRRTANEGHSGQSPGTVTKRVAAGDRLVLWSRGDHGGSARSVTGPWEWLGGCGAGCRRANATLPQILDCSHWRLNERPHQDRTVLADDDSRGGSACGCQVRSVTAAATRSWAGTFCMPTPGWADLPQSHMFARAGGIVRDDSWPTAASARLVLPDQAAPADPAGHRPRPDHAPVISSRPRPCVRTPPDRRP
jgi:hypothetical protein